VLHGATLALLLAATVVVGCAHGPRANPATRSALAEAETALKRRDYDAASAAYDRAVAAATATADRTLARRERAEARLFMGDLAGAEVDLAAVAELVPDDPRAWHDLGIVRANLGDPGGAAAALTRAKGLAPDDLRPRLALAALAWRHGDRARARAEYQALLDLELPDPVRSKVRWALDQLAQLELAPTAPR
jgi:Flp pilus assembly protein TadD